jgi:hypothetical protein
MFLLLSLWTPGPSRVACRASLLIYHLASLYRRAMVGENDILDAIDSGSFTSTRSSLVRWLTENHDAFAARLLGKRADWNALAALFAKAGLTDASGLPPKPETARKAWQRVQNDRRGKDPGDTRQQVRQQPIPTSPAPTSPTPEFDPGASRFVGKPAVMRSRLPKPTED